MSNEQLSMKQFSFKDFPKIYTERLLLRQLNSDDVLAIFKLRSHPKVNRFITRETPKNIEESAEFITICHQEFEKQNRIFWAIEDKSTKQLIGSIVYHRISIETNYAEIGYELDPSFHQKGFMSEAMKAVLEFGKSTMQLKTIEAFTHQNNTASKTLLEKHHFIFQPERREQGFENNRIFRLEINE